MAGVETARFLSKPMSLAARWLWLTAAVLLMLAVCAPAGFIACGPWGLAAAAVAAGVCWLAASVALALSACVSGPQAALASLVFGMTIRMGFPLAMFLWLRRYAELMDAGFVWQLGVFYLVMLAVETWLTLPDVSASSSAASVARVRTAGGMS